ncbi:MAG: methionyl-tRNA formyltransferase [Verrucomicrobiota bacterium]
MRLVFMGTGEIALPSLHWLIQSQGALGFDLVGVFTQPDKPVGRKQILTPPEVKVIAEAAGIPVFQPERLRKDEMALKNFSDLEPDLAVVMAYGQILPSAILETPQISCVNLHASLLPRHRGASPIQAAIRDGDEASGITLMHVEPKLDSGDMILRESIPIGPEETGGLLHDRLAELGPSLLGRGLPLLFSGSAPREAQDESFVTYAGKLERIDGHIDWSKNATEIERLIRAYDPWPGTYSNFPMEGGPKKLKIFPTVEVGGNTPGSPGSIVAEDGALRVCCREGSLLLTGAIQLEGKKRLPVKEWLRGFSLSPGTILQ